MSHCHQSSAMCHRVIILGGKGTHTGDCNARKPQTSHYLSRPVAKKNDQKPTRGGHYHSRKEKTGKTTYAQQTVP